MIAKKESFGSSGSDLVEKSLNLRQTSLNEITQPTSHCAINRSVVIRTLIQRSRDAYITDGIFKQGVDKYFEYFRDIELQGGTKQVQYLETRLTSMGLSAGVHWKVMLQSSILDMLKVGTTMIIKYRGNNKEKRALYKNRTSAISQLFPADVLAFEPEVKGDQFLGWKSVDTSKKIALNKSGSLKNGFIVASSAENVLSAPADVLILTYRKGPDNPYGIGMGFAALEDINMLRSIEQVIAVMIKKFATPKLHHTVERPPGFIGSLQQEINNAAQVWSNSGPDEVIITPSNHKVTVIGAESQAMRAEGYVKQITARACASMGLNPYALGFESGTIGSDAATRQMMQNRVKSIQVELANTLEMFLINELLWEGGFDPYQNEDDKVHLSFAETDVDEVIKKQNHAADLFQKDGMAHPELRKALKLDPKVPFDQFRSPMVGGVEHKFNKDLQGQKLSIDKAVQSKKAAGRPKKESIATEQELIDFLQEIGTTLNIPEESLVEMYPLLMELMEDPLALQELIKQYSNETA